MYSKQKVLRLLLLFALVSAVCAARKFLIDIDSVNYTLFQNVCYNFSADVEKHITESWKEDLNYTKGLINYSIQDSYRRSHNFSTNTLKIEFGWLMSKSVSMDISVKAAYKTSKMDSNYLLRNQLYEGWGTQTFSLKKQVTREALLMKDVDTNINNSVIINMPIQMTTVDAENYKLQSTNATIFCYKNCVFIGSSNHTYFQYIFTEPEERYEIVCAFVYVYDGKIPKKSPYNCAKDTVNPAPVLQPLQINNYINGTYSSFPCPPLAGNPPAVILARKTITTAEPKVATNGKIALVQRGVTRQKYVAINDPFTWSIVLTEDQHDSFQKAKSIKTFWYRNCTLVGSSLTTNLTSSFAQADRVYKITGVLVQIYDGLPPAESPYHCVRDTIKKNNKYAVGIFYAVYFTRDLTLNRKDTGPGELLLVQNGQPRRRIVAAKEPFNLSVKLEEADKRIVRNAKSVKSFWYANCTLLFSADQGSIQSQFIMVEQIYRMVAVLVAIYNESAPVDPPYDCATDTLKGNESYSVGTYYGEFVTRELQLNRPANGTGQIMLVQGGQIRKNIVSPDRQFTLSVKLDKADERLVRKAKSAKSFWYRNCILLGSSPNASFNSRFVEVDEIYKMVAVVVAAYEGKLDLQPPYNCEKKTFKTSYNYAVGAIEAEYITRGTKLENGVVNFLQRGIQRPYLIAVSENLLMKLELSEEHKKVVKRAKHVTTFWYRNCTLIGRSAGTNTTAIFRRPHQSSVIIGAFVATYDGAPPTKSPYICESKIFKEDVQYVVAAFLGVIATRVPIQNFQMKGSTTIRNTQQLKLISTAFTGSKPYKYCVLVFNGSYKRTGKEDCDDKAENLKDNRFEYRQTFSAGSKVLVFIVSNDISKAVRFVPINVAPVRKAASIFGKK